MTRIIPILFVAVLFFGCAKTDDGEKAAQDHSDAMTVSQLFEAPDGFVDKEVKLAGTVTHICKHAGKRLHLTDVENDEKIRVEAGEAIGGFDRDIEGSDVVITGILKEERIDEEYLVKWESEVREEFEADDHEDDGEGHVEPQGLEAIENTRKELAESGKEYLSRWSLECTSFEITAAAEVEVEDEHEHEGHDHEGHDHGAEEAEHE